jgi:hypothetical protein
MKKMLAAASFAAALLLPNSGGCEIRIEGSAEALRLDVSQESVGEVLAALAAHGVQVRAATIPDSLISGSFSGSLPRVLAALLDRFDYVIKVSDEEIGVAFLAARGGGPSIAAPASRPSAGPGLRTSISRVRK